MLVENDKDPVVLKGKNQFSTGRYEYEPQSGHHCAKA